MNRKKTVWGPEWKQERNTFTTFINLLEGEKNIYEKQTIVDFSTQSNQFFPIAL